MSVTQITATSIELANQDVNEVFIETTAAQAKVNDIKKDLSSLSETFNKISREYKSLANHKGTNGLYQTNLNSVVKATNHRATYSMNRSNEISSYLDKSIQEFTIATLSNELKELEEKVNGLLAAAAASESESEGESESTTADVETE